MCYHTHYIFLHCGHSVSSLRPVRPSPPCPNQHAEQPQPLTESATLAPQSEHRPFSFDPSVIASPTSPAPEAFPIQTPWRLESPFSAPESASSVAGEEVNMNQEAMNIQIPRPSAAVAAAAKDREEQENIPPDTQQRGRRRPEERAAAAKETPQKSCGQVLIHPYRTYKIEGLCLYCRRRRDTRLASFEVHAIRDTVYREPVLGPASHNGVQSRLKVHAQIGDGQLKPLPLQLPVSKLRKSVHFEGELQNLGEHQQQQTPWRLTLPPAQIPRTGRGLAGMRDGEWI